MSGVGFDPIVYGKLTDANDTSDCDQRAARSKRPHDYNGARFSRIEQIAVRRRGIAGHDAPIFHHEARWLYYPVFW
jgi:hypothetical protein